ncbi:hypothetical protein KKF84_11200 [Myxococcota bacterium]|nr:hypothetical protein [Myxococcota bacterium]MBU1535877.1 hypothetical protein [Myxococcota bacterium]
MHITFWGVRGFIPVPGAQSVRYGGNTICVGIECDDGTRLALDAGTGLSVWGRKLLGTDLGKGKGEFNLVITHSHYDHVQGFSFFIPALIPGNKIRVFGMDETNLSAEDILESQMTPIFSPMQTLKNFGSIITYPQLSSSGTEPVGSMELSLIDVPHATSRALAVKMKAEGGTVVYAPDVVYENAPSCERLINFYRGADVLIHDSTSTVHYNDILSSDFSNDYHDAVTVAGKAGVKRLFLIHYHQEMTDDNLDSLLEDARTYAREQGYLDLHISLAQEGYTLSL